MDVFRAVYNGINRKTVSIKAYASVFRRNIIYPGSLPIVSYMPDLDIFILRYLIVADRDPDRVFFSRLVICISVGDGDITGRYQRPFVFNSLCFFESLFRTDICPNGHHAVQADCTFSGFQLNGLTAEARICHYGYPVRAFRYIIYAGLRRKAVRYRGAQPAIRNTVQDYFLSRQDLCAAGKRSLYLYAFFLFRFCDTAFCICSAAANIKCIFYTEPFFSFYIVCFFYGNIRMAYYRNIRRVSIPCRGPVYPAVILIRAFAVFLFCFDLRSFRFFIFVQIFRAFFFNGFLRRLRRRNKKYTRIRYFKCSFPFFCFCFRFLQPAAFIKYEHCYRSFVFQRFFDLFSGYGYTYPVFSSRIQRPESRFRGVQDICFLYLLFVKASVKETICFFFTIQNYVTGAFPRKQS